jgi:predicted DNA-binding transcriptional regulator AlpA
MTNYNESIQETLLTIDDAALILRMKKSTIYRKMSQKTFPVPYRKQGNRIVFLASDLRKYISELPSFGGIINQRNNKED